jgi:hypothetical protein
VTVRQGKSVTVYSGQGQSEPQSGHGKKYWLGIALIMVPVWACSPDPAKHDAPPTRWSGSGGVVVSSWQRRWAYVGPAPSARMAMSRRERSSSLTAAGCGGWI